MFRLKKTDRQLVRQVLGGDRDEYESLVKRHYPTALSIALTYTGNSSDAEDVVQDSFVKAYTSLDKLKEPDKFLGWLSAIVRNAARKLYSKKKREQEILQQHQPASSEPAPDVSMREMMELMRHRLGGLDDTHREVLTMYYFGGQNSTEIAQALGVNKEAVLKRLQRAREALGHEMMAAIKDPEEEEKNHSTQIAKIARAVIATGIAWEVAGMKAGLAAAAMLTAAKAVLVVGGFAAAGVGVYSITTNYNPVSGPAETTQSTEFGDTYRTVPMITAMDEEARKQLASGPSLVRNSQVHAERAQTMDLPLPANPSTKQLRADLDGSRWSAKMLEGGRANEKGIFGSTEFQLDFRHTDIAEEVKGFHLEAGDWMALTGLDLLSNGFEIVGKAEAPHVAFDVYYGDTDTSPHRYMKLAGAFTSDWQKIILSGKSYSNEVLKVELSRKKDPTVNELNGTIWSVKEFTGDGKTDGGVNEGFRYELKIRNDKISIVDLDGAPVILGFKGSVQDNQVEMELTIDVPGDIEKQYIGDVAGAFGPKRNTLELTGKIFSADLNKNVDLLIGLERMTEGFERELLIARYENEAETLLQKLIEFTKSNENTLPNQLRDLEFTVHNHKRLIQNSSIRKVSYFPPSNRELNLANWSSEPVSVGYYMDMEGDSIPDKMMNFERMLLDVRGPFPSYLVVARIEHYDVRVGFELDLKSQRVFQRDLPPVGDTAALQQFNARLRASCANNMKQLGLSLKMFENESKGEFISGGWATIYPEYLVDPRVLLCPGKNGEECSYDILYPASNRRYWEEIHSELFGSGAPYDGSKIPWLIERKECGSESGGRNVYFHDGHVEFIKNEAWTERMGRFLKYSYTIR